MNKATSSRPTPLGDVNSLMRAPSVIDSRGLAKSQHYADCQNGLFTPPLKIGKHASAWPTSEVAALNAARIAGWTADKIRDLVVKLMAARAALAEGLPQ